MESYWKDEPLNQESYQRGLCQKAGRSIPLPRYLLNPSVLPSLLIPWLKLLSSLTGITSSWLAPSLQCCLWSVHSPHGSRSDLSKVTAWWCQFPCSDGSMLRLIKVQMPSPHLHSLPELAPLLLSLISQRCPPGAPSFWCSGTQAFWRCDSFCLDISLFPFSPPTPTYP